MPIIKLVIKFPKFIFFLIKTLVKHKNEFLTIKTKLFQLILVKNSYNKDCSHALNILNLIKKERKGLISKYLYGISKMNKIITL